MSTGAASLPKSQHPAHSSAHVHEHAETSTPEQAQTTSDGPVDPRAAYAERVAQRGAPAPRREQLRRTHHHHHPRDAASTHREQQIRGALGRGGGGRRARGGQGLDYDTRGYRLRSRSLPTAQADRTALRNSLDQTLTQRYPQGYQINGAAQGSDEELRAMDALVQYGNMRDGSGTRIDHRNTESDLLVPTGGTNAPMRMTAQTAQTGAVTATVHNSTGAPQPARAFANTRDATQALQRDYGVTVNNGSANWTASELSQVHHSFSQMSADERRNLRGVELRRDHRPPSGERQDLSGLYSPNVASRNGQRVRPASIALYDRAFTHDNRGFVGDGRTDHSHSVQTVLHEAGHAVEGQPFNNAMAANNQAIDRMNTASDAYNRANQQIEQPLQDMNSQLGTYNQAARGARLSRPQLRQTRAFNSSNSQVTSALNRLNRANSPQAITTAQAQLQTATQRRDRALAAMAQDHPLRQASTDLAASQDALATASNGAAAPHADYLRARSAQRTTEQAMNRLGQNNDSNRLASFERMMQRSGERGATAYGQTSSSEAFAEAYALYRADPQYLRQNRPQTYRWFQQGHHNR